jgi:hypothetical protein
MTEVTNKNAPIMVGAEISHPAAISESENMRISPYA